MTDDIRCEACGSGDAEEELLLCGGYDRCLRPILLRVPAGDCFCHSCASSSAKSASSKNKKPKQFPLVQTMIVDFFKIQQSPASAEAPERNKRKRKRKPAAVLVVSKKKRKLLPFSPSEDPARWRSSPLRSWLPARLQQRAHPRAQHGPTACQLRGS